MEGSLVCFVSFKLLTNFSHAKHISGWPNLVLTPTGGFMGMGTNTGKQVEMRGKPSFYKPTTTLESLINVILVINVMRGDF